MEYGGYGFAAITELADKAEHRIKAAEPVDQVAAEVNNLIGLIRRVEGYDHVREKRSAAEDPGH